MTDQDIVSIARQYSLTSDENLYATVEIMRTLEGTDGDMVECGVWQGGHIIAAMLASTQPRTFWLYDTFEGMTEPGPEDYRRGRHATETAKYRKRGPQNWCRCDIETVTDNVEQYRGPHQVIYRKGPVEITLHESPLPEQVAFLRLDTDFYASTKIELQVLYPRLIVGGAMVIDDYGSWDGCRKAVDEYFNGKLSHTAIDRRAIRTVKMETETCD